MRIRIIDNVKVRRKNELIEIEKKTSINGQKKWQRQGKMKKTSLEILASSESRE